MEVGQEVRPGGESVTTSPPISLPCNFTPYLEVFVISGGLYE
jgi:hypothetical protein